MRRKVLCIALVCLPCVPAEAAERPAARRARRVEQAVSEGAAFLVKHIRGDGQAVGEYPKDNRRRLHGGRTALCVHALLTAGSDERREPLSRAVSWLGEAELDGVYPVAMRACAFTRLRHADASEQLRKDARWLVRAANPDGSYTYAPSRGGEVLTYDNASSFIAALGLWDAASCGAPVPAEHWKRIRRHWTDQQQPDGGWGYAVHRGALRARTYGSMTAAGLAALYACGDHLKSDAFVRCTGTSEFEPIVKAHEWLARRFAGEVNPGKGVEWKWFWLFCVQRVGMASGYKYFGEHDWYAAGAEALLDSTHPAGGWGYGDAESRIEPTALALLFLAGGRHPVAFNKLRYEGRWNPRPRDLAGLTRWLTHRLERPMSWQVVGTGRGDENWHDAPILYISGAGAWDISEERVRRLRRYVLEGGLIVSEAACGSGAFTQDMRRLYRRLFPEWPLERLAEDHPIYTAQFRPAGLAGLSGVSNGVRLLAVHAPRELSLALQLGPQDGRNAPFELMANILRVACGGDLPPRGYDPWPAPVKARPKARMHVVRLAVGDNPDPEPLAWERLALLAARRGIRLDVSGPISPEKLDAGKQPIATMTGTGRFELSEESAAALRGYVARGGALIVDAAGGSEPFAASVREQVLPLVEGGEAGRLPADHSIYQALSRQEVAYRRAYAQTLGAEARHTGRLEAVAAGRRLAIVFSPEDLTAGLVGYPGYRVRGYTPETAVELMLSILRHLSDEGQKP